MTRNALLIAGLIGVVGGIHLATLRDGQEWGDDFSLYVAHARNIAEGRPYADTGYVYNSADAVLSPRTYPPVFPLLLVPVYLLFGMNLLAMKVFVVLLFMALLGVLAGLFYKRLPLPYVLACLALFALNPYVWQHKDRLLSEVPFMLFAYLALVLAETAQEASSRRRALAWGLLAGAAAYLAFGTRTVGAVLIPSFLLCDWWRQRRLSPASLMIVATFAAGVAAQKCLLVVEGSYLDQLIFDPALFARIGLSLARALGYFLENGYSNAARLLLYACLLVPAMWAYLARLRGRLSPCELFAAFNCLILVFWPAAEYERRFLLPILPLFFLYVCEGLRRLQTTSIRRVEKPLALSLSLALLLSYLGCFTRIDWVKQQTNPQDVFLFQKPRAFALYTGRRSLAHHKADDAPRLARTLRKHGATHVVVYHNSPFPIFQKSGQLVESFIADNATGFEKVYENACFRVYRIRDGSLASR
jgi:4-amino-4-deoxy-L-arabinose transferase-like glycosyltransferase